MSGSVQFFSSVVYSTLKVYCRDTVLYTTLIVYCSDAVLYRERQPKQVARTENCIILPEKCTVHCTVYSTIPCITAQYSVHEHNTVYSTLQFTVM